MSARSSKDDVRVVALLERLIASVDGLREDVRNGLEHLGESSNCPSDVPPDPHSLLTAADVAALLQINVRTLRRMRHERSFPRPTRVGRALRWKRSLVERWLDGSAR